MTSTVIGKSTAIDFAAGNPFGSASPLRAASASNAADNDVLPKPSPSVPAGIVA
ncbi:hypothetical protein ACVW0I_008408 [Bradyrhizobium sp. LM6.11]